MKTQDDSWLKLGKISGVYGIKGWIKVFAYTAERKNILDYQPWYIERNKKRQAIKVLGGRLQGKSIVAQLEGLDDRNEAETWVGLGIYIPREQLAKPAKDEFYWADLIGLQVETVGGEALGKIDHILETGANDVLVVKGERERLIPFVMHQVITKVDIESQRMVVDWDPDF